MNLEAENVLYTYPGGVKAAGGVSIAIEPGRLVALAGPNGSGKSTLLRLLAGLLRPDDGVVKLDGKDMESYSRLEAARLVGFLPQEVEPAFEYSAGEIVMMGRHPHLGAFGFERKKDVEAAEKAMKETDTSSLAGRRFGELSGGERRRVLVAGVLAQEPLVMLLDEPTGALDVRYQVEIYSLLSRLARGGMALGVVTHDLNLASEFADDIVLLDSGCVAAKGKPVDIIRKEVLEPVYRTRLVTGTNPETGAATVLPAGGETEEPK